METRQFTNCAFHVTCLVVMITATTAAFAQAPGTLPIPRVRAEQLYELASARFDSYETAHGGYVSTKNVRMHYLHWGDAKGVPLVWAPGTYSPAYEMAPFAEQLVAAGYWVIAIDYYGHGKTPIPEHEVSLWHVADDIAALMDSLAIPKAVIGGWSRGGAIAAAFYNAYPSRVLGLVLEDGGSFSFPKAYDRMPDERLNRRFGPDYASRAIGLVLEDGGSYDSIRAPVEYASAREAFIDAIQWNRALNRDDPVWALQTLARVSRGDNGKWMINRGLSQWLEEDSRPRLVNLVRRPSLTPLFQWSIGTVVPPVIFRNLDVAVLILDPVEDDDAFPATDQNQQLQRAHPSLVTHRIYEKTSHAAKLERPDWFLQDMRTFMERLSRQTSR